MRKISFHYFIHIFFLFIYSLMSIVIKQGVKLIYNCTNLQKFYTCSLQCKMFAIQVFGKYQFSDIWDTIPSILYNQRSTMELISVRFGWLKEVNKKCKELTSGEYNINYISLTSAWSFFYIYTREDLVSRNVAIKQGATDIQSYSWYYYLRQYYVVHNNTMKDTHLLFRKITENIVPFEYST